MTRSRRYAAAALVLLVFCTSCMRTVTLSTVDVTPSSTTSEAPLRSATNLPTSFTIVKAAPSAAECPPLLADSLYRTTLSLRRSVVVPVQDANGVHHRAIGDYAIDPPLRYGAGPDDLLRVDCARMRAIGIVAS